MPLPLPLRFVEFARALLEDGVFPVPMTRDEPLVRCGRRAGDGELPCVLDLWRGEKLGGSDAEPSVAGLCIAGCPVPREGMKLGGLSHVSLSPDSCTM